MPEFEDTVFPADAWEEIFSAAPRYPDLPDDLVRAIAGLGIRVREMGGQLEDGVKRHDLLTFNMPLSLIMGSMRDIADLADRLWAAGVPEPGYLLDDGDPSAS
jgi:hypothetical protein